MERKSYYSVEGSFKVDDKIVFEERAYHKATSDKEAVKMAKEDGNVGPGMIFHNLEESTEYNLRKATLGELLLMIMSKN